MRAESVGLYFISLTAVWLISAWFALSGGQSPRLARGQVGASGVCLVLALYFLTR